MRIENIRQFIKDKAVEFGAKPDTEFNKPYVERNNTGENALKDDVTSESSPYDIVTDCVVYDDTMYKIVARAIYQDTGIDPVCCTGEGSESPIDGEDLIIGNAEVVIQMQ